MDSNPFLMWDVLIYFTARLPSREMRAPLITDTEAVRIGHSPCVIHQKGTCEMSFRKGKVKLINKKTLPYKKKSQ